MATLTFLSLWPRVVATLDEVETSGNKTPGSRVTGLADAERIAEQRVAEMHRSSRAIRSEMTAAFADLNGVVKKFV